MIEALPLFVIVTRRSDGKIVFANTRALEWFGVAPDEVSKIQTIEHYVNKADRQAAMNRLEEKGELGAIEVEVKMPDRSLAWMAGCCAPIDFLGEPAIVSAYKDVTNDRETARQLRVVQKMDALRRVAGGIAHELNNALVPVMSFTQLAIEELDRGSTAAAHLEHVVKGALRASELTQKVLEYSRSKPTKHEAVDLKYLAVEAIELLRTCIPYRVGLEQESDPESEMYVSADPTMLRDLILNLGMSAADAIGQDRGTITVRVHPRPVGSVELGRGTGSYDARWAELTVSDTGSSIDDGPPADELDDWDPAANLDGGRNRDLSVIHGIVIEFGGEVSVLSDLESGTTVTILLPLCQPPNIESDEPKPRVLATEIKQRRSR